MEVTAALVLIVKILVGKTVTGCQFWSVDCEFIENLSQLGAASSFVLTKLTKSSPHENGATHTWIWIAAAISGAVLVMTFCIFCYLLTRRKLSGEKRITVDHNELLNFMNSNRPAGVNGLQNDGRVGHDLSEFSYTSVLEATCNFSEENKLGEGGFGPVYKGKLVMGQEIAVKRLSKCSGQGTLEFKNELIIVYELQHTNLVQLCGFCIHGEERILIYEYMPNKSLDYFLFDSTRGVLLDWNRRFSIIEGIAQGMEVMERRCRAKVNGYNTRHIIQYRSTVKMRPCWSAMC